MSLKILLKSVKVIDPSSAHNGKVVDILIHNGTIKQIGTGLSEEGAELFAEKDICVSPGWFDSRANFRDPGFEQKEDLESGCKAAIAGGFTAVAVSPDTLPPVYNKTGVEYIKNKSKDFPVDFYPLGALSQKLEGNEIAEMYDMFEAGAIAFTDDKKSVANTSLLLRGLLYAKNFNGLVLSYPEDKHLAGKSQVHEGFHSTKAGMKGIPSLAEEIIVRRDIALAEYAETSIHITGISTSGGLEAIKEAKQRGQQVSCDMNFYQIALSDEHLESFDSNYKVKPPLRDKKNIQALKDALKDGTLEVICSDHSPEDEESKNVEFEYAAYGMLGLELCYAVTKTFSGLSDDQIIEKISINPRRIYKLPPVSVQEGGIASLTLFSPNVKWTFKTDHIRSKSKNTPFLNQELTGRAEAIVNKGKLIPSH